MPGLPGYASAPHGGILKVSRGLSSLRWENTKEKNLIIPLLTSAKYGTPEMKKPSAKRAFINQIFVNVICRLF